VVSRLGSFTRAHEGKQTHSLERELHRDVMLVSCIGRGKATWTAKMKLKSHGGGGFELSAAIVVLLYIQKGKTSASFERFPCVFSSRMDGSLEQFESTAAE
jgi:hypothetical protein